MSKGRVALVTGAGRGIGREVALLLAQRGCRVALLDLQVDGLDPLVAEMPQQLIAVSANVADWRQVDRAVTQVESAWGAVEILVNNAALVKNIGRSEKMSPEAWEQELAVNLSGPFYLTRRVLPQMIENGWGRIINISSIAVRGLDRQAGYASSKAGLIGLTRTIALEHGANGITCNAIIPGLIATENVLAMPAEIRDRAVELIPTGRLGAPREIAEAVAFLASPEASYINGAALPVDGGAGLNQMTLARRPRLEQNAE